MNTLRAYTPIYTVKKTINSGDFSTTDVSSIAVTGLNTSGRLVGFYGYAKKTGGFTTNHTAILAWDDPTQSYLDVTGGLGSISDGMATCVNGTGWIGGVCWTAQVGTQQQLGFVWLNGMATTFASPEGGDIDTVVAVNSTGQAVCTYIGDTGFKRAFFWDGTQSTDLGDLGDPDNSFIWPVSLSDTGQVVGTLYTENSPVHPSPTTAFVWLPRGQMSLVDANNQFLNTTAIGQNGVGMITGSFLAQNKTGGQTLVSGGYSFMAGADALNDLGSLGGGGTLPFFLNELGGITGTSYTNGNTLHLFDWQPGGALTDLGNAWTMADDKSFQLTSVNQNGDAAGFVTDVHDGVHVFVRAGGGNTLYLLENITNGLLNIAPNNSAGQQVFINDTGLLACPGTDRGQGLPEVLLLTSDINGNALPDGWEKYYFGGPVANPEAPAPSGDGYTILQEYQLGRNPLDYYQGVAPGVQITAGNNQRGVSGTVLTRPLVTQITISGSNAPQINAPVTYKVTAGVAQIAASSAGPWGGSCSVRTSASGQATVFCRMSVATSTSIASTIQLTAGSAVPLVFNAYVLSSVAAGFSHSLALDTSGYVWAWGDDTYGELGNDASGTAGGSPSRVLGASGVGYLDGIVAVAAGSYYSLALRGSDGSVWAWGRNTYGELGNNSVSPEIVPLPVQVFAQVTGGGTTPLLGVIAIAAGNTHSLALTSDGSVWAWGDNSYGELGNGTTNQSLVAVPVSGLSGVVAISGGSRHSVALTSNGTLWAWGDNSYNELGDGGSVSYSYTPTGVSNLQNIVAVAAGGTHTLALRSDGTVWAWGSDYEGELGIDTEGSSRSVAVQVVGIGAPISGSTPNPPASSLGFLSGVVGIAAGQSHSLAVLGNGGACAWGYGTQGQLGNDTTGAATGDSDYPVMVVSTTGSGTLSGISAVSGGNNYSMAVLAYDGVPVFLGWGDDNLGEVDGAIPARAADHVQNTSPIYRLFPVVVQVAADADQDGLADWQEFAMGTNPLNPSSNGNGILDGIVFAVGINPINFSPGLPAANPNDHTPPQITITFPAVGVTQL